MEKESLFSSSSGAKCARFFTMLDVVIDNVRGSVTTVIFTRVRYWTVMYAARVLSSEFVYARCSSLFVSPGDSPFSRCLSTLITSPWSFLRKIISITSAPGDSHGF